MKGGCPISAEEMYWQELEAQYIFDQMLRNGSSTEDIWEILN